MGGEPTLQGDLTSFIQKIKTLGFLVKLDTSGIKPELLSSLIETKEVDYVAMDIKGPLHSYPDIVGRKVDIEKISNSIQLLLKNKVPYEFRTTMLPALHSKEAIIEISQLINGAKRYVLQSFRGGHILNPAFSSEESFSEEALLAFQKIGEEFVEECLIR